MILSIEPPQALLRIILEQSDIDDSTIGVDVARAARAFYPIPASHREHLWQDVAISFSSPKRTLNTLPVEIIRMGALPHSHNFQTCCVHRVNHPLERHDFFLEATDHKPFGELDEIDWRV